MDAHSLSQNGYVYRKSTRHLSSNASRLAHGADRAPHGPSFDLISRIWPLYEQAGLPFGKDDNGLWLWLAFGRRTHGN